MKERQSLTLLELNRLVRETIEWQLPDRYWVLAELSQVHEVHGHCYLQLVQKEEHSHTPVAQAQARCWRTTWNMVRPRFEKATGQALRAGLKVMLQVSAQFHENYGFSWIVNDIDPTFTLGDLARRRQDIVRRLKEEGVFELNKELQLPLFAQRVAVVSSAGAAGYGDFVDQLTHNEHGFCFHPELFEAVMQGEQVEQSVIAALDRVYRRCDEFDCVVIIRGGGAVADMSGFDTLKLAENVANFPLPVITGIGHDRDECVLDMISHTRVKTPTAAAAFLVDHLVRVDERIERARAYIINKVESRMAHEQYRLARLSQAVPRLFALVRTRQEARLDRLNDRMGHCAVARMQRERLRLERGEDRLGQLGRQLLVAGQHRLQLLAQRLELLDPERLLRRGYSITTLHGKVVRDVSKLKAGDVIETRLGKGVAKSEVIK